MLMCCVRIVFLNKYENVVQVCIRYCLEEAHYLSWGWFIRASDVAFHELWRPKSSPWLINRLIVARSLGKSVNYVSELFDYLITATPHILILRETLLLEKSVNSRFFVECPDFNFNNTLTAWLMLLYSFTHQRHFGIFSFSWLVKWL